jgi:hypothetical protein
MTKLIAKIASATIDMRWMELLKLTQIDLRARNFGGGLSAIPVSVLVAGTKLTVQATISEDTRCDSGSDRSNSKGWIFQSQLNGHGEAAESL